MRNKRGFTLIEVIIAAFVLAVAVLAMLGLQLTSLRSSAKAKELREAAAIAENILQDARATAIDDISAACPDDETVEGLDVECQVTPCVLDTDSVTCNDGLTDPDLYDVQVQISKDSDVLVSSHTYVRPTKRMGDVTGDEDEH